jgi:hypothetical protein
MNLAICAHLCYTPGSMCDGRLELWSRGIRLSRSRYATSGRRFGILLCLRRISWSVYLGSAQLGGT